MGTSSRRFIRNHPTPSSLVSYANDIVLVLILRDMVCTAALNQKVQCSIKPINPTCQWARLRVLKLAESLALERLLGNLVLRLIGLEVLRQLEWRSLTRIVGITLMLFGGRARLYPALFYITSGIHLCLIRVYMCRYLLHRLQ